MMNKEDKDMMFDPITGQIGCMSIHAPKSDPVDSVGSGGWQPSYPAFSSN